MGLTGHREGGRAAPESRTAEGSWMSRRTYVVVGAFLALAAAAVIGGVLASRGDNASAERMREARMLLKNAAAPGRIDKIVNGGEADRSALDSPAEEDYENRAFPASAVAFAQTENALKAARKVLKHEGVRFAKSWDAIGPDTVDVDTFGTQTFGPPTQWSGRISALVVSPRCNSESCRVYIGAAGGGVWRTNNALAQRAEWRQVSDGEIPTTSIGSLTIDPTDPTGRTIYAGTGEGNGASDNEAGVGLYKSTDGGEHWSLVPGSLAVAKDRAISAVTIDPANANHILIGTTVARHGLSSESGGRFTPPNAPLIGLYQSFDGGATFTLALNRPQDPVNPASANGGDFYRGGVSEIRYDPNDPHTFYAAMFGYGLFRSSDNGATFENIYPDTLSATDLLSVR